MTDDRMKKFEEHLTGGFEHRKWHFVIDKETNEREAVLFFMDAEYDPVRVTYDWEGCINIQADSHTYHCLDADTLRWLADMTDEIEDAIDAWMDGSAPEIEAHWGKPDEDESDGE